MRILDRYILKELVAPFLIGCASFVVIMAGNVVYVLVDLIVSKRIPAYPVLQLLAYRLPWIIVLALPVSMLFATALSVNRLARDSEIKALRGAGISLLRLIYPILLISILVSILTFLLNEYLVPWANHRSQNIIRNWVLRQHSPTILQNQFFTSGNYYFYIKQINPQTATLHDLLIYEFAGKTFPRVIIAKQAKYTDNHWYLQNGYIHIYDQEGLWLSTSAFKEIKLDLKEPIQKYLTDQRTPLEMAASELRAQISVFGHSGIDVKPLQVELHFKYSIPFACFIFALIAAPLSLKFAHTGSFMGILIAIALLFLYYCLMAWSRTLGLKGILPPVFAAWSQNILFGLAGLWLLFSQE